MTIAHAKRRTLTCADGFNPTSVLAGRLPSMGLWDSLTSLLYPQPLEVADAALAASCR